MLIRLQCPPSNAFFAAATFEDGSAKGLVWNTLLQIAEVQWWLRAPAPDSAGAGHQSSSGAAGDPGQLSFVNGHLTTARAPDP